MTPIEAVRMCIARIRAPRAKPNMQPVSCAEFSDVEYYAVQEALREALEQLDRCRPPSDIERSNAERAASLADTAEAARIALAGVGDDGSLKFEAATAQATYHEIWRLKRDAALLARLRRFEPWAADEPSNREVILSLVGDEWRLEVRDLRRPALEATGTLVHVLGVAIEGVP